MERPIVLVVADDVQGSEQLGSWLHPACETVASPSATALEVLARTDVELVLLDLTGATLDGLALCRTIKARPGFLPVVLLTSLDGSQEELNRGLEAGADEILWKPVWRRRRARRSSRPCGPRWTASATSATRAPPR